MIPTLRQVLLVTVILAACSIIVTVTLFFKDQYRKEALIHVRHYAISLAANVAAAEAEFIITENFASLQDSLPALSDRAHVLAITIVGPDDTVLASTDPEYLGIDVSAEKIWITNAPSANIFNEFREGTMRVIQPIQVGGNTIGWCDLLLDTSYIQEGFRIIQKKIVLVTMLALLVVSLVLYFVSLIITRPLDAVIEQAARVADGDLDQQVSVKGLTETRRLGQVFNAMTRAIKDRENSLRQAQKMEAIGRLSSSIAHEFGNPLIGIVFLLEKLKRNDRLGRDDRALIELGLEECVRMKSFIRDLKCFYRPSSGEKKLIDLHRLIDKILLFQESYLDSRKVKPVKAFGENIPAVLAVEDQIKQVLMNLLLNSVESMKNGGTVTIGTMVREDKVLVIVKDTGGGISPEHLENIFIPFFSTKPEVCGTGLGLSVSYGIMKNQQGDIKVTSEPGKGTAFTLVFPVPGPEEAGTIGAPDPPCL